MQIPVLTVIITAIMSVASIVAFVYVIRLGGQSPKSIMAGAVLLVLIVVLAAITCSLIFPS